MDKQLFWVIALVASMVFNLVLGWRSITDSKIQTEVIQQKQEIVELQTRVGYLTEEICRLNQKVDKATIFRSAAVSSFSDPVPFPKEETR